MNPKGNITRVIFYQVLKKQNLPSILTIKPYNKRVDRIISFNTPIRPKEAVKSREEVKQK